MIILWSASFLIIVQRIIAQGQVSGNAIDLANMNMNMMQTKCSLQPCQSVCLVKQPETGCFICNPKCNAGTNLGMPDSGLPMQMQPINSGQAGFYTGCEHDNWLQCPMTCTRKFDTKGCFQCQCQTTGKLEGTTKQASIVTVSTKSAASVTLPSIITTSTSSASTSNPTKSTTKAPTSTITPSTTTEKPSTNKFISLVTENSESPVTSKIILDDRLQTQTPENPRQAVDPFSYDKEKNITSTFADSEKDSIYHNANQAENDSFKPNNLTFILFGIMIVLATFCLVFLIAWRKSSRKLKKNKNELYFVHKAYRQDSRAHLSHNEMMDPVYADIGPRPEPPPRSPPGTRSNITTTTVGPERSLSQSSETPLKEPSDDDVKHDYLELI